MQKYKILVVDDNKEIGDVITLYANKINLDVDFILDSKKVLKVLENVKYDMIVLDVDMPNLDGFELFELIKRDYSTPILFLSAKTHEDDRIKGLLLGAEDYIIKPFSIKELFIKIDIILQRLEPSKIEIDDFKFDLEKAEVYYKESKIKLTPKSYHLLFYLVKNKGTSLTREEILKEVWNTEHFLDSRTIDAHIKELRKKIDGNLIKTLRNKGYMYEKS